MEKEHQGNEFFVNCLYIVDVSRMWTIVSNSTTVYNIWKDLIKFITGPENGLSPLILGAVGGACVLFVITVAICIAMKCKSNNDR